jgi:hypothetical protein
MFYRILITAGMLAAMTLTVGNARAAGGAKLPDWAGAWARPIVPGFLLLTIRISRRALDRTAADAGICGGLAG